MVRWCWKYVDTSSKREPTDNRGSEFGKKKAIQPNFPDAYQLALTVDLRAKLYRNKYPLVTIYDGNNPNTYVLSNNQKDSTMNMWRNQVVIAIYDKGITV